MTSPRPIVTPPKSSPPGSMPWGLGFQQTDLGEQTVSNRSLSDLLRLYKPFQGEKHVPRFNLLATVSNEVFLFEVKTPLVYEPLSFARLPITQSSIPPCSCSQRLSRADFLPPGRKA